MHDHRAFGPVQTAHGYPVLPRPGGHYDEPWPPYDHAVPAPYTPPHSHRKPGRLARIMRLLGYPGDSP